MSSARLLDIAVREFGAKGLDGASTRGIAEAAATAMSSITYHFGSKEGLYLAAADHVAQRMGEGLDPCLIGGDLPVDPPAARAALHALLAHMIAKFVSEHDEDWSMFIAREQMKPTEACDRLYASPRGEMSERLVARVAAATGAGDLDSRIAAVALFGQVIVWRGSRALAARVIARPMEADVLAAIAARIRRNTEAVLDSLMERGPQ